MAAIRLSDTGREAAPTRRDDANGIVHALFSRGRSLTA